MPTDIKIAPLTGPLDVRSEPEQIPKNGWRMLQNMSVGGINGRLCRAPQWRRLFGTTLNSDLHDQLLDLQVTYEKIVDDDSAVMVYPPNNPDFELSCSAVGSIRPQGLQPITFGKQVESSSAVRKLLAGTQSRLYALNERGQNWRILGDGFGGEDSSPDIRWAHASVGDYSIFSNNYDELVYWVFDAPTSGCAMQAVKPIPDLQTIAVTKAKVVLAYRGIVIIANLEEDGQRKTNMVRWSNLRAPLDWIEDPGVSAAGHMELDDGEEILAGDVQGDFAYLYTNRSIWQISVSSDPDLIFSPRQIYKHDKGDACIKYPNTFVSLGDASIYMAEDGIYVWSQYNPKPVRVEWIHQASGIIYDNINASNCAAHTAGFNPVTKELRFSVAVDEDILPSVTLVCNMKYSHAYREDFGWTMLMSYVPDNRPSVRDFFIETCLLSAACLASDEAKALGVGDPKEGVTLPNSASCESFPLHIYTGVSLTVDGFEVEDYTQPTSSEDSMCAVLSSIILNTLCKKCEAATVFIGASTGDYCLKEFGGVYYRERHIGEGQYEQDGYTSRMLKCLPGNSAMAALTNVLLQYSAAIQTPALKMNLKVGASPRADDPLNSCTIQWSDEGDRDVECVDNDKSMEWNTWAADCFLYVDFTMTGVGGVSCFSSLEMQLQKTC